MMTAEQNYCLLKEIEADRRFLLMAYQQNPKLLESAEMRIKQLFEMPAHGADNNQSSVLSPQSSERGISLIELIMFIVIVSVALAGILLVMNVTTRGSADPLVHKQALAIAESLLEEVELQPFTYCDPNDTTASTASSATLGALACTAQVENMGPEAGETRYSATTPFDNVNDYNGFNMAAGAILDITGSNIGLSGYLASVAVAAQAFSGIAALDGNGTPQVLLITVTVTGTDGLPVVMEGIRTRYSPNGLP